jgi:FkbM family methyltransferase
VVGRGARLSLRRRLRGLGAVRPLLRRVRRSTLIPWIARARMMTALSRVSLGLGKKRDVGVRLRGGPVFLGRRSLSIDVITVLDIWNDEMFPAQCRGRIVLDIGGHKGYFGAWALARGAVGVLSCEPERENFVLLERARRRNGRGSAWVVEKVAVGDRIHDVPLFVSNESWAHSLYEDMVAPVAVEVVPMRPLAGLIERAQGWWPGLEIVLKVNVEGAAGAVLFPVTSTDLASVVEIHLDHEPGSPYELDDLLRHLAQAGLDDVERTGTMGRLLTIRRGGSHRTI